MALSRIHWASCQNCVSCKCTCCWLFVLCGGHALNLFFDKKNLQRCLFSVIYDFCWRVWEKKYAIKIDINTVFLELLSKDSRLNNNSLMGPIPMSLTNISALQVLWVILYLKIYVLYLFFSICICITYIYLILFTKCRDLSNNQLSGVVPDNGSFSLFTPIRFLLNCVCS